MKNDMRVSRKQVEELNQIIGERDKAVLLSLQKCRYLTTRQIQRLHFTNLSPTAAIRVASRVLKRLREHGLIGTLKRQIGGVRAGSSGFIWSLTLAGFKLLALDKGDDAGRKRFYEPSAHYVEHTLLVSEAYLQMVEICNQHGMTLAAADPEPMSWRHYTGRQGKKITLRPDLYAVTQGGGYEDRWFMELDRATESTTQVLNQCEQYMRYFQSGAEQKRHGVFPYVLWIVPNDKRKTDLTGKIRDQHARDPNLFIVITPDELETLVVGGVDEYMKKVTPP
ncbi:MAG: replication-relaxation family protein [Oscillospiraceae bacterium]|jgi:hypothetical protein|nr:replication-relaxation family protein [Oscillospiraceae bacterium]